MAQELLDMLTTGQAAHRLGISTQRLAILVLQGDLDYVSTPLGRLFSPADIDRLVEQRRLNPPRRSGRPRRFDRLTPTDGNGTHGR